MAKRTSIKSAKGAVRRNTKAGSYGGTLSAGPTPAPRNAQCPRCSGTRFLARWCDGTLCNHSKLVREYGQVIEGRGHMLWKCVSCGADGIGLEQPRLRQLEQFDLDLDTD